MQPSRMVYSHQPCPDQLEHRASLLLFCLTRLTNHPDIPKQQLPAITSSRTHVPITCTPISSLALDLGQISALGCSRARLLHPRSWRLDRTSPGCRPRGLSSPSPCPHLSFSSLASTQGQQLLPPQTPVLGRRSQPETQTREWCTQESSNASSHPTQAARLPKSLNSITPEGSTWDLGELWDSERDQVGVPGSVQAAAPRFSHFSSYFRGDLPSSHSPRPCPQHWELQLVSDMALLLTNHPGNLWVPPWRFGCRKKMPPGDWSHAEPETPTLCYHLGECNAARCT